MSIENINKQNSFLGSYTYGSSNPINAGQQGTDVSIFNRRAYSYNTLASSMPWSPFNNNSSENTDSSYTESLMPWSPSTDVTYTGSSLPWNPFNSASYNNTDSSYTGDYGPQVGNADSSYDGSSMPWRPTSSSIGSSYDMLSMPWGPKFDDTNYNNTSSANSYPANKTSTPGTGMNNAAAGTYANVRLDQEQVNNAKIIADVGKSMGMSQKDIQTAIATAMQESSLRNVNHGDAAGPDSCGLFQQRDSWGSREERMNPASAARLFYNALSKVKGREQMSVTEAAYKVQRCAARYKDYYAKWENMAGSLLA